MGSVVIVANDVRLKVVFEYLRHVVHRGIQHHHGRAATLENVKDGGYDIPRRPHQSRSRLEENLKVVPGLEKIYGGV